MSPSVLRHPALVVGVAAALGTATVAPVAAAATATSPTVSTQGLLGGLLAPVTTTVTEVLASVAPSGLPAVLPPTTVTALTDALTNGVDALVPSDAASLLSALSPAQVQQLAASLSPAELQQLAQNPATMVALLDGLVPTLTGLAGGSAVPTDAVTDALSQLTSVLAGGGLPTDAAGLASLTEVLGQVTSLLGSPDVAALPVVGPLIGALAQVGQALPDGPAKTAVVDALTALGGGLGLTPAQTQAALAALGLVRATPAAGTATIKPTVPGSIGGFGASAAPSAATPAATSTAAKPLRGKILSVKISKNRKKVSVRVQCPAKASAAGCTVRPSVKVGGKTAKTTRSAVVTRGKTRTFSAKVPASVAKKVRRSGGRVVARVTTTGSPSGAVSKTIRVRRSS